MLEKLIKPGLIMVPLLALLWGCGVELRSPIKITRTKEEEKASPPKKVVVAPSPAASTDSERSKGEYETKAAPSPEPSKEEPSTGPEASRELSVSTAQPQTVSPEDIVILSSEYLANARYKTLGKVTVKDVSQNGLSEKEAKEALKIEAFRQFGRQAKGVTKVTYQGETSFFGSERYYEASGDVVTWEAEDNPRKPLD